MPLVADTDLPSFRRLVAEGGTVLPRQAALRQDIRELHIGLLNMMPDRALEATERQFFRLIGESNQIAQFYLHPFTVDELPRAAAGKAHTRRYYKSFRQIKEEGLDALIISGANVVGPRLDSQPFWKPLREIFDWAYDNVTSILCSCLATHAVLQFRYGQQRAPLAQKCWGVFPHRVTDRQHPLITGMNTRFDVPHSRHNVITAEQFRAAGLKILAQTEPADGRPADVHLAVSEDGIRIVFFQGHPEYDAISLLKEYKREVGAYLEGKSAAYPPFPQNYLRPRAKAILGEFREQAEQARAESAPIPDFPEAMLRPDLDNTWHDSAEAVLNNWIGKVYQLTHLERKRPFRDDVDPNNPLGMGDASRRE